MRKLTIVLMLSAVIVAPFLKAQKIGVKTNLLYGIVSRTPNIGVEVSLKEKHTVEIHAGYNPWNQKGLHHNNKKLVHWSVQPEWKYWFSSSFKGHFVGVNGLASYYNINKINVPLMFDKKFRYQGYLLGAGLSYGYQWFLGKRWNLEASVGLGAAYMNYDKYECNSCGFQIEKDKRKLYFGPTKAAISIIYMIK